ncbi:Tfp pilus assembly protein FimT/FimU, partial [Geobacter sp.]|uniref:pilus assembly FimT family protein n=1 Tax=Geobacter sp. TaxID=46610 RepID=UPI0027B9D8E1
TLLELILVVAIISIMSAIAVPAFSSLYGDFRLKSVVREIRDIIRDAKLLSIQDKPCAIEFNPDRSLITLVSGKGDDDKWGTGDESVVRRLALPGGISFGYGSRGPIKGSNEHKDGISFTDNRFACLTGITGEKGTVYLQSQSGGAMAVTVNDGEFNLHVRKWSGGEWVDI